MIVHGIVRLPFKDVEPVYVWLAKEYKIFLAKQHDADDGVKTTHVHFLVDLSGTQHITAKAPLESFRKTFLLKAHFSERGIYELKTKTQEARLPYDLEKLAIYILKGQDPDICTDQLRANIANYKALWKGGSTGHVAEGHMPVETPGATSESVLVSYKKITDWNLLQELIHEPAISFGGVSWDAFEHRTEVNPKTLMKHVIQALKFHHLKPTPKRVNEFIGSMLMYYDDTQDLYQGTAIGQFLYHFEKKQ